MECIKCRNRITKMNDIEIEDCWAKFDDKTNIFIQNRLQIDTGVTNVIRSGNIFNGEPPSSEPPSSEPPNPNPGNGDIPPVPAEGDTIVIEGSKLEKIILIKKKE